MSDVKGRLREIMNTTLSGNSERSSTNTKVRYDSSIGKRNKSIYNSVYNSTSTDLSFDNFKKMKSRTDSLNSSNLFGNKSHKYTPISTESSILKQNPKLLNKSTANSLLSNFELMTPPSNSPLYFSEISTQKIKKEINNVQQSITQGKLPKTGFRNRPVLNLNRPELEFNSREFFATSPTVTKRNLLTTSSLAKKSHTPKYTSYFSGKGINLYSKNEFKALHQSNQSEFEDFKRELVPSSNKFSVFDSYTLSKGKKKSGYGYY